MRIHKFELRPREGLGEDSVQSGATTELFMDGKRMNGVRKVTVEIEAAEIAKLTIEVYGQFHVVGQFSPEFITQKVVELEPKEQE